MWKSLVLGCILAFLTQSLAWAGLGQTYSLDTFKPYLQRKYNTLLGWRGQPVTLADPHLYLYHPKTQVPIAMIEFLYQDQRLHTEIFKLFKGYHALDYAEEQELKWFLVLATQGRITPKHLETIAQTRGNQGACNSAQTYRILAGGTPYYLTFYSNPDETFVKVSLLAPPQNLKDYQTCFSGK